MSETIFLSRNPSSVWHGIQDKRAKMMWLGYRFHKNLKLERERERPFSWSWRSESSASEEDRSFLASSRERIKALMSFLFLRTWIKSSENDSSRSASIFRDESDIRQNPSSRWLFWILIKRGKNTRSCFKRGKRWNENLNGMNFCTKRLVVYQKVGNIYFFMALLLEIYPKFNLNRRWW